MAPIDHDSGWNSDVTNTETRIANVRSLVEPPLAARELLTLHREELRRLLLACSEPGYLVVAIFANRHVAGHAHLPTGMAPGAVLVVGRHSRCGLCLEHDETVALRHVVMRAPQQCGGRPALKVFDLKTGQGFQVDGIGRCDAVAADGPLCIRVGSYSLICLPTATGEDFAQASFIQASRATVLPGLAGLDARSDVDAGNRETAGTLMCAGLGPSANYSLSTAQLQRGVLVGRYDRCDVGPRARVAAGSVSRVHLLLLAEGADVVAIDTASQNCSRCDGQAFATTVLPASASIRLGGSVCLRWQRGQPARGKPRSRWAVLSMVGVVVFGLLGGGWLARPAPRSSVSLVEQIALPASKRAPKCIDPLVDLGADSPSLRLFLYRSLPDVCFAYRWEPEGAEEEEDEE
jgi:hypothetical protein